MRDFPITSLFGSKIQIDLDLAPATATTTTTTITTTIPRDRRLICYKIEKRVDFLQSLLCNCSHFWGKPYLGSELGQFFAVCLAACMRNKRSLAPTLHSQYPSVARMMATSAVSLSTSSAKNVLPCIRRKKTKQNKGTHTS